MGRSTSPVTLEYALKTQSNAAIISEEVEAKNQSLEDIVNYIAKVIKAEADKGLNYGTLLVPEGLIEFIPATKKLIQELNDMLAANQKKFDKILANKKLNLL